MIRCYLSEFYLYTGVIHMFNLNGTIFYIHQSLYRLFQKFKRDTVMYICFDCSFGSTVQESNLGASIRSHKTFFRANPQEDLAYFFCQLCLYYHYILDNLPFKVIYNIVFIIIIIFASFL